MTEIIWADASAQAAWIRAGEVSAAEILDAYLDRIERYDPQLRAYVAVDAERATEDARRADDLVRAGAESVPPFLGVTISIKDVIDVAGLATTHSSRALADNVRASDGPLVARLRRAGFVILGKTNVPEFCSSMTSSDLNGICRNPWDLERTPSGSSGGAGAALAAGLCAVAHGTDGAGSVRSPASFCGLVGTKPTRGLVSFGPDEGSSYYRSSVDGVLSRSVRDAAATLDAFAGWYEPEGWWPGRPVASLSTTGSVEPGPLRVAVTTSYLVGDVDEECANAARETGKVLEALGHHVVEATPRWEVILAAAAGPMDVPGPAGLVTLDRLDLVEPRNRPLVERGAAATLVDHAAWVEECRAASREFLQFWSDVDVLVSPTMGMLPPSVDWAPWDQTPDEHMATFMTLANFAQPCNLSGQPALSLPLAWSTSGLPIGVQCAGRPFEEATLFRLAAQLETAMPWADRRPPGFP